jgi:hypothetical protein
MISRRVLIKVLVDKKLDCGSYNSVDFDVKRAFRQELIFQFAAVKNGVKKQSAKIVKN